jgi:hypothetical protein
MSKGYCYAMIDGNLVTVYKGIGYTLFHEGKAKVSADELNAMCGISKREASALVRGALYGWNTKRERRTA